MAGTAIVQEIITIITAGLVQMGQSLGAGVTALVNGLWFTTADNTTTLSVFAIMVCVFGGIALAVGLSRLIFNWLGSLGGSR